ncbi:hypothetical protein BDK51DRAFT_27961, partial [Blyttiomyces helicus]
ALLTSELLIEGSEISETSVTIGDVVPCRISIRSDLWQLAETELDLVYDVEVDMRYWMFSGKKRSGFCLKSCLHLVANPALLTVDQVKDYVKELNDAASKMEKTVVREDDPIFVPTVLTLINRVGDDDGLVVEVDIHSKLCEVFRFNDIGLALLGGEANDFWCTQKDVELKPGGNVVRLVGEKTSVPGTYVADRLAMQAGKLRFNYKELQSKSRKHMFRINENATSLKVAVSLPDPLVYGESHNNLLVKIFTRQNTIKSGFVSISPVTGMTLLNVKAVTFRTITCSEEPHPIAREQTIETADGKMAIPSCGENEMMEFWLPYILPSDGKTHEHKLKIVLTYVTEDRKRRLHSTIEKVKLAMPFVVSQSTVYNTSGIMLQMKLTGNEEIPWRIVETTLSTPPNFHVEEFPCSTDPTIFHRQDFSYLFRLTPKEAALPDTGTKRSSFFEPLNPKVQFSITYYSSGEEIETYILTLLDTLLESRNLRKYSGFLTHYLRDHVLSDLDFIAYGMRDVVHLEPFNRAPLEGLLTSEEAQVREELVDLMDGFLKSVSKISAQEVRKTVQIRPTTLIYQMEPPVCK